MTGNDTNTKGTTMKTAIKKLNARQMAALVAFATYTETGWPEGVMRCTALALLGRGLIEVVSSTGLQYASDYVPNFCGKGYHVRRTAYCVTRYAITDAGRELLNG
jgi:hypothetical protein